MESDVNFEKVATIAFPAPQSIDVNMMPFVIGSPESVPEWLKQYQPMIDACDIEKEERGKVGYITVTEGLVPSGSSHRRAGIHTERHPLIGWGGGGWGAGCYDARRYGGIYMASNLDNTTAVWDVRIEDPGAGGNCEHLRSSIGAPQLLKANELIWMTDATPHESLPLQKDSFRQFFRIVTSEVSLWYSKNSTANPLGVEPPSSVEVIVEDKFAALIP
jgi:hypothetical protein